MIGKGDVELYREAVEFHRGEPTGDDIVRLKACVSRLRSIVALVRKSIDRTARVRTAS